MTTRRLKDCVENWPDCESGEYNPSCCRFPKVCTPTSYDDGIDGSMLEPPIVEFRRELTDHRDARIGDPVQVTFNGTYVGYDDALGVHHLAGSFVGDGLPHITWTIQAHWSADLHTDRPQEGACDD